MASEAVDTRVVEAKFDSAQFEKGVDKTVKKLDELKKSLNLESAGKSITQIADKTEEAANKASESLDKLTNRLTTFTGMLKQKIIGGIADEIVNGLFKIKNAFLGLFNALGSQQISVGMQRYTDIMTSVRTMLHSGWKDMNMDLAYASIEKLGVYADQTSYPLDHLVNLMSQLMTGGAGPDDAVHMVQGLSNAAASLGVNAQRATIAYNNFAQAWQKGYMLQQDYQSFQLIGMAGPEFQQRIIDAAVKQGTLVVDDAKKGTYKTSNKKIKGVKTSGADAKGITKENMGSKLSSRWFTKEVMAEVFGSTYYFDAIEPAQLQVLEKLKEKSPEKFKAKLKDLGLTEFAYDAFKAAQEARSFTDVLNTLKDTISRGWATSFQYIFGKLDEAAEFFTWLSESSLATAIYTIGEFRNEMLQTWAESGGAQNFRDALKEIDAIIGDLLVSLGILNDDDTIETMLEGDLDDYDDYTEGFRTKAQNLGRSLKKASVELKEWATSVHEWFNEEVELGDGTKQKRIDRLAKVLSDFAKTFGLLFQILGTGMSGAGRLLGIAFDTLDRLHIALRPLIDTIGGSINQILQPILDLVNPHKQEGQPDPYKDISNSLINLTNVVSKLSGPLETVFKVLGDVGSFFISIATDVWATNISFFSDLLALLLEVLGLGSEQEKNGAGVLAGISEEITNIGNACREALSFVQGFFHALLSDIGKILGINVEIKGEGNDGLFSGIATYLSNDDFIGRANKWLHTTIENVKKFIIDIPNKIKNFGKQIINTVYSSLFGKKIVTYRDNLGHLQSKEVEFSTQLNEWLKDVNEDIRTWLDALPANITKFVTNAGNFIGEVFNAIFDFLFGKKKYTGVEAQYKDGKLQSSGVELRNFLDSGLYQLINTVWEFIKSIPAKIAQLPSLVNTFFHSLLYKKEHHTETYREGNMLQTREVETEVETGLNQWLHQFAEDLKEWFKNLPQKITTLLGNAGNFVGNVIQNVVDWIFGEKKYAGLETYKDSSGAYQTRTVEYRDALNSGLNELLTVVWGFIKSIPGRIAELPSILGTFFHSMFFDEKLQRNEKGAYEMRSVMKPWVYSIIEAVKNFAKSIPGYISKALKTAGNGIKTIGEFIFNIFFSKKLQRNNKGAYETRIIMQPWLYSVVEAVKNFIKSLPGYLHIAIGGIGSFFTMIWESLFGKGDSKDAVNSAMDGVFSAIKSPFDTDKHGVFETIKEFGRKVLNWILEIFTGSDDWVENENWLAKNVAEAITWIKTKAETAWKDVKNWFLDIPTKISNLFSDNTFKSIKEGASDKNKSPIERAILDFAYSVGVFISEIPDALLTFFTSAENEISKYWQKLIDWILGKNSQSAFKKADGKHQTFNKGAIRKNLQTGIIEATKDVVAVDNIDKDFMGLAEKNPIIENIEHFFQHLGEVIRERVEHLPTDIVNGLTTLGSLFGTLLETVKTWFISDNDKSIKDSEGNDSEFLIALKTLGETLYNLLTETIPGFIKEAFVWIKDKAINIAVLIGSLFTDYDEEELRGKVTKVFDDVENWIRTAINGLKNLFNPKAKEDPLIDKKDFKKILGFDVNDPFSNLLKNNYKYKTWEKNNPFKNMRDDLKDGINELNNKTVFEEIIENIGESIGSAFQTIGPVILNGINEALKFVGKGMTWLTNFFNTRDKNEDLDVSLAKAVEGESEDNKPFATAILSVGQTLKNLITNILPGFITSGVEEVGNMIRKKNIFNTIIEWFIPSANADSLDANDQLISNSTEVKKNVENGLISFTNAIGKGINDSMLEILSPISFPNLPELIMDKFRYGLFEGSSQNAFPGIPNLINPDATSAIADSVNGTKKVTDGATGLLGIFGNFLDKAKDFMNDDITKMIVLLIAVGVVLTKLRDITTISDEIESFGYSAKWVGLSTLMMGLVGLVGYIAYLAAQTNSEADDSTLNKTLNAIERLVNFFTKIVSALDLLFAIKGIGSFFDFLGGRNKKEITKVSGAKDILLKGVTGLFSNILGTTGKAFAIGGAAVLYTDAITDSFTTLFDGIADIFTTIGIGISNAISGISPTIDQLNLMSEKIDTAITAVGKLGTLITTFLESFGLSENGSGSAVDWAIFTLNTMNGTGETQSAIAGAAIEKTFDERLSFMLNMAMFINSLGKGIKSIGEIENPEEAIKRLNNILKNDGEGSFIELIHRLLEATDLALSGFTPKNLSFTKTSDFLLVFSVLSSTLDIFSSSISGISLESITALTGILDIFERLAQAADSHFTTESALSKYFSGDKNLGKFGREIQSFGINAKSFFNSVNNVELSDEKRTKEKLRMVLNVAFEMARAISELNGNFTAPTTNIDNLKTMGSYLPDLGDNLKTFIDNILEVNNGDPLSEKSRSFVNDVTLMVKDLSEAVKNMSDISKDTNALSKIMWSFTDMLLGERTGQFDESNKEIRNRNGFLHSIAEFITELSEVTGAAGLNESNAGKAFTIITDMTKDIGLLILAVRDYFTFEPNAPVDSIFDNLASALDIIVNKKSTFDEFFAMTEKYNHGALENAALFFRGLRDLGEALTLFGNEKVTNLGIQNISSEDWEYLAERLSYIKETIYNRIMQDYGDFGEDIMSPKITPVLEITEDFKVQAAQLRALLGLPTAETPNLEIPSNQMGYDLSSLINSMSIKEPQHDYTESLSGIKTEITYLRSSVDKTVTDINNLKVVINSKTLVGAIGPDMDKYLGTESYFAERLAHDGP